MKKTIALLMAALLMLTCLSACATQPADPAAPGGSQTETGGSGKERPTTSGREDNSFTSSIVDQIVTLDPQLQTLTSENLISMQIYEPLFYIDNDGEIQNALIESYTRNDDNSVDFVLKSGVQYHSGDTLTAEDVAYSLSRCENSTLCSALYGTVEMTIADDTHFTWAFPAADAGAGFDALKSYIQHLSIVNKSYCEEIIDDPNENLGLNCDGTGPYEFVEAKGNGDVTLQRFADYHGKASFDTLYFKYITGSQETAFEAGDLDYAMYGATNYALIKDYDNVTAKDQVLNSITFLISNCTENGKFSDARVRQAAAYCLSKDDITSIGSADAGTTAYNLATPMVTYYADNCDHFDQDLEKANDLMSEAGYSENQKLDITLVVMSAYPDWVSGCEVIKENLEQSYFTVNIEQVADTSRYFTYDFDLGMISLSLTTEFSSYSVLFDTASGLNLAGLEDERIKEAFAAIRDEASAQNAMKLATESLAYIPLFYNTVFFAFDDQLNTSEFYVSSNQFLFSEFSWK